MATTLIDTLNSQLDDTVAQMQAVLEQEDRSEAADANLTALEAQAQQYRDRLDEAVRVEELRRSGSDLMARQVRARARTTGPEEIRSPGTVFTESRAFADYRGAGQSAPVTIPMLATRAPILTTTDLGAGPHRPQEVPGWGPTLATTLWDVISKITVSQGNVEFPVYSAGSPAPVVAEGAAKPAMTWSMEMVERTIPKVAHHVEYSREFASDKAALRSIIDGELVNGVWRALNSQAASAINAVATAPVEGATLLEAIRNAQASVEGIEDGYSANTLLIHPLDAATLDLALLGATVEGARFGFPVWGLRVVKSNRVTVGRPLVLDLSAVVAYVRTGVEVFQTDSHAGNFLLNVITAVAEARALTTVQRPDLVVPATVAP